MKCVGLYQPHASLAAIAEKCIETRSWRVWHRGEMAIYATKAFPKENQQFTLQPPASDILRNHGILREQYCDMPTGRVIAVAQLVEILPIVAPAGRMFDYDIFEAARRHMRLHGHPDWRPGEYELAFGDYRDGRYAWLLANVRRLRQPVPARGYQGMWKLKPHEEALVRAELAA